jgi:TP901 family phage tail tape measure protein
VADLEIRVTSKNQSGAGFASAKRDVQALKSEFDKVERASKIDSKVNVDDAELDAVKRAIDKLDNESIDVDVDVDDAELGSARREIDKLDNESIDVDVNVEVDDSQVNQSIDGIESKFANIDLSGMSGAMTSQFTSIMSVGGALGIAAGIGAESLGGAFSEGFSNALNRRRDRIQNAVRFDLDPGEMLAVGRASGDAYTAGFGESLSELRNTAATLRNELSGVDASLDLTEATRQATVLADVFGVDLPSSINLARRLVANDMARDTSQAFDLMTATAQQFNVNFQELLDVAEEFSPVFGKLGISGAEAFGTMGKLVQEGLLPNVDRAAELFEEFNIRLSETDTLRSVIQRLGLDFERMQSMLANGQGGQALKEITGALLEIEDPAQRNALALEIFGAAIESAADPEYALEILNQGEALENVAGAASRAAAAIEESNSAASNRRKVWNLAVGDAERWAEIEQELANKYLPETTTAARDLALAVGEGAGSWEDHQRALSGAGDGYEDLAPEINVVAERMADLQAEADRAESALRSLSDWADSSGEAALRGIYEAADEIAGSFGAATLAAYDLSTGWDLTSEAGRSGSLAAEKLRGDVARVTDEFLRGETTSGQYQAAMTSLENSIRAAGAAAGWSETEIDAFVDSILGIPTLSEVEVRAKTEEASSRIRDLNARLDGLDGTTVSTYANHYNTTYNRTYRDTIIRNIRRYAAGGIVGGSSAAEGGIRGGESVLVGENGPEVVELPAGSNVRSNPDTNSILDRITSSSGGLNLTVNVMGSVMSERELVGTIRDQLLQASL